jgi:hypothetical protein
MAAMQKISWVTAAATLALMLSACSKDAAAPEAPAAAPTESPAPPGESVPAPATEVLPADSAEPAPSPSPEPPPPTEPSAVPKPTSAEPQLDAMQAATASAKMSVPVDLRYQFESDPSVDQPVTLHLAAVPRVAGTRLNVSIKPVEGLQVAADPLEISKVAAKSAYRQTLSITRRAGAPESLRVLVTMEMPQGTGFGYYSIPLTGGKTAQKQNSVKQR